MKIVNFVGRRLIFVGISPTKVISVLIMVIESYVWIETHVDVGWMRWTVQNPKSS